MKTFVLLILTFSSSSLTAQSSKTNSYSLHTGASAITLNRFYTYKVLTVNFSIERQTELLGLKSRYFFQTNTNRILSVYDKRNDFSTQGWEVGLSVGFEISIFQNEQMDFYMGTSIGPALINASHSRQKEGFVVNEEAHLGLSISIFSGSSLIFQTGYRHLSNANWNTLNGGIDTWNICVGLRYYER